MKMKYTQEELSQTGIYAIIHRESGKVYIGSAARSFRERWALHKTQLRKGQHHSRYLQNAWTKHSEFAFDFQILEIVPQEEWIDDQYLTDVEQMWLDSTQAYERSKGYNVCTIAGSCLGYKHSEEARRKIGEAHKGRVHSEEARRRMSEALKGRVFSEDHRRKMSEARVKTYTFISPEGKEVTFTNLRAFCMANDLNQSVMCKLAQGKYKQHKGWRQAS